MSIFVQFSDANETSIISVFASPQDEVAYPNQGTVETTDASWHSFYAELQAEMASCWPAPTTAATT